MDDLIKKIRKDLKQNANEEIKKSGQRFFKEDVNLYGIKTAVVKKIGKEYFRSIKDKSTKEIYQYGEQLWKSGYLEESFIACNWSYAVRKKYLKEDFIIFESWVTRYVSNWASCDTLCNHTIGAFIEQYPYSLQQLKKWAVSENRWERRAAAVSLIVPAKRGLFLKNIFEIADILILDEDDLVQKGYGWMLKAASQVHLQEVFDYVIKNKNKMPRTALRYAIEKMPKELKALAMEK